MLPSHPLLTASHTCYLNRKKKKKTEAVVAKDKGRESLRGRLLNL